jgi:hypothetical protein
VCRHCLRCDNGILGEQIGSFVTMSRSHVVPTHYSKGPRHINRCDILRISCRIIFTSAWISRSVSLLPRAALLLVSLFYHRASSRERGHLPEPDNVIGVVIVCSVTTRYISRSLLAWQCKLKECTNCGTLTEILLSLWIGSVAMMVHEMKAFPVGSHVLIGEA